MRLQIEPDRGSINNWVWPNLKYEELVKPAISDSSESHSRQTKTKQSVRLVEVNSSTALTSRNGNLLQNDKITVTQQLGVKFLRAIITPH